MVSRSKQVQSMVHIKRKTNKRCAISEKKFDKLSTAKTVPGIHSVIHTFDVQRKLLATFSRGLTPSVLVMPMIISEPVHRRLREVLVPGKEKKAQELGSWCEEGRGDGSNFGAHSHNGHNNLYVPR